MATYTAYLTYTVSDEIHIEADSYDEALTMAENWERTFEPLQVSTNSIYDWDGVEISLDDTPEN
jgi:hypothetical protein